MKKRKKVLLLLLTALILFGGLYAITYIPKKIITIEPSEVSKIEIFDGNAGEEISVTEPKQIQHIISNLNGITFKKENLSLGYMGYTFKMTIYNDEGKEHKELIINSSTKIRYKGFFYIDESDSIDFDYISDLFKK